MRAIAVVGLLSILGAPALPAGIYGTIQTTDGREVTGTIRWDRNEVFWDDVLDAQKTAVADLPAEPEPEGLRLNVLGWKLDLGDRRGRAWGLTVPFGNIRSIEREGDGARIELQGGGTIEAVGHGSTDLGPSLRSVVVRAPDGAETELAWPEIARVWLREGPDESRRDGERLYGTLRLRDGSSLTGFVSLDKNLALTTDSVRGGGRVDAGEVGLGDVRSLVRRVGGRAAVVPRAADAADPTATEVEISNVDLAVPGVGHAGIDWDDCERLDFAPAPASPRYDSFGGRRIRGTVETVDGAAHAGKIVWDMDEAWTFEAVDGRAGEVYWSVPFDSIDSIEPRGRDAAKLVLRGGSELVLSGTHDVNQDNRGILVIEDGGLTHEIEWGDLRKVTVSRP